MVCVLCRVSVPDCQPYSGGLCASGGLKILVPDATEPGLIAHYNFDDDRASDSSGHGNHAKVVPNAGPGHGPVGAGAWFDGVKSMEVPHIPAMASPDLTVSFWLYLLEDSTNSYRTLVRKAKAVQDMTPAIMLLPNDRRLHIRLTTTAGSSASATVVGFDSTSVIPLRRWTHVAYVLKGGAALSLYVNGVKEGCVASNMDTGLARWCSKWPSKGKTVCKNFYCCRRHCCAVVARISLFVGFRTLFLLYVLKQCEANRELRL